MLHLAAAGPRAPLRIGAENRFKSLHVNCDFNFTDRPDAAETLRANISQARKQVDAWKAQLKTTPAEQQKALQDKIDAYNKQIPEAEKLLPGLRSSPTATRPSASRTAPTCQVGAMGGKIARTSARSTSPRPVKKAPCNDMQTFET